MSFPVFQPERTLHWSVQMMDKGIVVLSFDDGRQDNYHIFMELLKPRNLPATVNIATGYVQGQCNVCGEGIKLPALTKEQVAELAKQELFEVACHGDRHSNTPEDIISGRDKLISWLNLPQDAKIGFASPGSDMSSEYIRNNTAAFDAMGFSYVRTGLRYKTLPKMRILCRKAARVLHFPFLYRFAYAETLMAEGEGKLITAVPVVRDITVAEVNALADLAARDKKLLVLMFHSVTGAAYELHRNDPWCYDQDKFIKILENLVRLRELNQIDIKTTEQAFALLSGAGTDA